MDLVRHIPSWMPGAGFKRHALKTRKAVQEMINVPYEMVKKAKVGVPVLLHMPLHSEHNLIS